jgi:hypothetical protein
MPKSHHPVWTMNRADLHFLILSTNLHGAMVHGMVQWCFPKENSTMAEVDVVTDITSSSPCQVHFFVILLREQDAKKCGRGHGF